MTLEEKINHLIELATEYSESRNLNAEEYVDGVLSFRDDRDPEPIIDILIRYHEDWLR